jgi:peptidoglycan/xylan/chitin deacetylase (PgdA/CDA1 family)
MLELALEHAFWQGVRSAATERELQRLTRSSFVAFYYHRIAGASPHDRLDVPPATFAAQLRLLRLLRFHALTPEDMLSFHCEPGGVLPRRSYVLTADDAFRDAVDAFAQAAAHRPQMFASTQLLGRRLPWADADAATWDELAEAARQGVSVGSHTRTHRRLPDLGDDELEQELAGSLRDLRDLPHAIPVLAYPHGDHDRRVRAAAKSAGYSAAYTTAPGRNGAGSHAFQLSRIGVKPGDSRLSFLWKAITGAHPPQPWEAWRQALYRLSLSRRRARGRPRRASRRR